MSIKENASQVPSREHQAVWLKHYFDEMGKTGDQEDLINDYLDSIALMVPMVILHFVLAGIFIAQNSQDHMVMLQKRRRHRPSASCLAIVTDDLKIYL